MIKNCSVRELGPRGGTERGGHYITLNCSLHGDGWSTEGGACYLLLRQHCSPSTEAASAFRS